MRDKLGHFVKGHNINLGKHHSEETKQKMSRIRKIYLKFNPQKGERHPSWKGGHFKDSRGYIRIHKPNHPFCQYYGYVLEHRLIMEKHLGRFLKPQEIVHHINGNIADNRIDNLMLFPNHSAHRKFHYFNH